MAALGTVGTYRDEGERKKRELTQGERRVRGWIKQHYGAFSSIARECNVSPQFVERIAYNREARSKDLRVERKLQALGCPLMQKI